jgi:hypothetical protein
VLSLHLTQDVEGQVELLAIVFVSVGTELVVMD